jgi:uncharacterized membrane protein
VPKVAVQGGCDHEPVGRQEVTERPDPAFWGRPQRKTLWPLSGSAIVDLMITALAIVVFVTIAAVVALWPGGPSVRSRAVVVSKTVPGRVTHVAGVRCSVSASQSCQVVTARVLGGRDKGSVTTFDFLPTPGAARLAVGDRVRLLRNPPAPQGAPRLSKYSFSDFDRRLPLLWLGIAFVALLLATGRFHGLRALIGLGVSLAIILKFVIPSILQGNSAVAVALTGALAVMLITIPLCYGIRAKAIAAWLGTTISLVLAVFLAWLFTHLTHLSGASSDEASFLSATDSKISLPGLLLAGMVVGALGVLVDLTVSQASTVIALRRANPSLRFGGLFRGALDVGHDHIAATVNTLVFAYAGAALPVLLIFSIGGTSFTDAVNSEAVAEEIVASLIGSIGLIASMPITTALAALLAPRMSDKQLQAEHAHAH